MNGSQALLVELLKSAPSAVAILVTVFAFLKAQAHRDREFADALRANTATLAALKELILQFLPTRGGRH